MFIGLKILVGIRSDSGSAQPTVRTVRLVPREVTRSRVSGTSTRRVSTPTSTSRSKTSTWMSSTSARRRKGKFEPEKYRRFQAVARSIAL